MCVQDGHHGIASPAVDGHQEHLQFPYQEEQADLQHRKSLPVSYTEDTGDETGLYRVIFNAHINELVLQAEILIQEKGCRLRSSRVQKAR